MLFVPNLDKEYHPYPVRDTADNLSILETNNGRKVPKDCYKKVGSREYG